MASPIIFNHDAAIDEYMAAVLLTTLEDFETQGFIITNADCIADPAMDTQWKIQSFTESTDVPLALSQARGWNSFPWSYRADCIKQGAVPALTQYGVPLNGWPPDQSGEELLTTLLSQAIESATPVTMLVNCPLTTLADVMKVNPDLEKGMSRLIWMGGAINVPGNLDPNTVPAAIANPSAEWNAFWDPYAVDWIFQNTTVPLTVFPLDVTNQAAITPEFREALRKQSTYRYSQLAYQSYALVSAEPFYDMWDVVTTCYIPRPDLFETPSPMELMIETQGFYQGTLRQQAGGRLADVVLNLADPKGFYQYVLTQFKR
ncbi:MAG: nucleoside hydrolase [Dehalococcoidia bacterium]